MCVVCLCTCVSTVSMFLRDQSLPANFLSPYMCMCVCVCVCVCVCASVCLSEHNVCVYIMCAPVLTCALPSCSSGQGDLAQMDVGSNPAGAANTLTSMKSHSQDQVHRTPSQAQMKAEQSDRCLYTVKNYRGL